MPQCSKVPVNFRALSPDKIPRKQMPQATMFAILRLARQRKRRAALLSRKRGETCHLAGQGDATIQYELLRIFCESIAKCPEAVIYASTLASTVRFGGVIDFLPFPFVRVRESCPGARSFTSHQTLMPERDQAHFHVN